MNHHINDTNITGRKVALVGVGGAGTNTLNEILKGNIPVVRSIAVNRDKASLIKSKAQDKVALDAIKNSPETIAISVQQKEIIVRKLFDGMDAVVLMAGMGGMTGSYASPEIARIARQCGLTIWAVATMPFVFEGTRRAREARKGFELLTRHANAVICVNNQDLIKESEENMTMLAAFRRVDVAVAEMVAVIAEHGELTGELLGQLPKGFSVIQSEPACRTTDSSSPSSNKTENTKSGGGASVPENTYCSFCGKHRSYVKKLISGPMVFICNECVDQCVAIMAEESD